MKKFIKWFLFWFLVLGAIALAICYMAIPEQTKNAVDVVIGYLNTPFGIVGGTSITLGLVVAIVFKFVVQKYGLDFDEEIKKAKIYAESQKQQTNEYLMATETIKKETESMLGAYSQRIDNLKKWIVQLCETSPNAKIKALGEEINNSDFQLKEEQKATLEEIGNEFVTALEEKVNVDDLNKKVKELSETIRKLVEDYGKESEND